MDHLSLTLVYRFGLVLASKGYRSGDIAMQVVSTLARYARLSVVERYLRQVEDASRNYDSKRDIDTPSDLLSGAYSLAIRTFALGGKDAAALALTSTARSRGIHIPDFTLNMVAKRALDRQTAMDRIRAAYASWNVQDTTSHLVSIERNVIATEHAASRHRGAGSPSSYATRRHAITHAPPSPHALHTFMA